MSFVDASIRYCNCCILHPAIELDPAHFVACSAGSSAANRHVFNISNNGEEVYFASHFLNYDLSFAITCFF